MLVSKEKREGGWVTPDNESDTHPLTALRAIGLWVEDIIVRIIVLAQLILQHIEGLHHGKNSVATIVLQVPQFSLADSGRINQAHLSCRRRLQWQVFVRFEHCMPLCHCLCADCFCAVSVWDTDTAPHASMPSARLATCPAVAPPRVSETCDTDTTACRGGARSSFRRPEPRCAALLSSNHVRHLHEQLTPPTHATARSRRVRLPLGRGRCR